MCTNIDQNGCGFSVKTRRAKAAETDVGTSKPKPEESLPKTNHSRRATVETEDEDSEEESEIRVGPPKKAVKWADTKKPAGTAKVNSRGELPFVDVPRRSTEPLGKWEPIKNKAEQTKSGEPLPILERKNPSFSKKAPVEDENSLERVIGEVWGLEMPLTLKDLASISPEAREYLKKMLTKRRIPRTGQHLEDERAVLKLILQLSPDETSRSISYIEMIQREEEGELALPTLGSEVRTVSEETLELSQNCLAVEELPQQGFLISEGQGEIPKGAFVQTDPVEQYHLSLGAEETPRPIKVAKESSALRVVYPQINNGEIEEAMLDGGSQICSMHEEIARRLGLTWDPDITVVLTTANKSSSKTLGLAKNVPVKFGAATVYIQFHVIPGVAYKVLLGQPFDLAMATGLKTETNGDQTLTLTDPNTGARVAMPTYPKGKRPPAHIQEALWAQEQAHFQDSRNWSKIKESSPL